MTLHNDLIKVKSSHSYVCIYRKAFAATPYDEQGRKQMNTTADAASHAPLEVLSFRLGNEEYGLSIQKVQELRGYDTVTRIANSPAFIKGVINLRGIIVPIVDMRIRFNLGTPTYDPLTVVVILNIAGRTIGMVVDSVSDVITLSSEQIRPAPDMQGAVDSECIFGIGTIDERMLILIDIDKLMSSPDMGLLAEEAS